MNIEWSVTVKLFTVEDDLVAAISEKVYAPTQHMATMKAQMLAGKRGKEANADYWLVDVE